MAAVGRQESLPVPYLTREGRAFRIKAVIFDLDGTLTEPGAINFAEVHESVGCPRELGLLEFLQGVADPEKRRAKEAVLKRAEVEAAEKSRLRRGAEQLVRSLRAEGIPLGIVTRNCREAALLVLERLGGVRREDFAVLVTRDDDVVPKPLPDSIDYAARQLGVETAEVLVIGDHRFDIEAGKRAGALTMHLRSDSGSGHTEETEVGWGADFVVADLAEAAEIIHFGLPLPAGKLPVSLLQKGLDTIALRDQRVMIGAAVGEDAAAVDVSTEEVLVLASDPITLAADSLGRYAVLVNANDVATAGATPRWLLTTLLFPPGSSASEILRLTRDIDSACAACGVTLCGGHTEISDAVSRPLVVGTMAGTALAAQLIDKRRMRKGDRILVTKGVAVEGTGLLAREFPARLRESGFTQSEIDRCAAFLDNIGVIEEAGIARSFAGVTALHDVTEGGLATAVRELGLAGGHRVRVHLERIPVYPETMRLCEVFGLHPLGLIGSGSLLITCASDETPALCEALRVAGIPVTDIGEVLEEGQGVEAWREGKREDWPLFDRDEVSRIVG